MLRFSRTLLAALAMVGALAALAAAQAPPSSSPAAFTLPTELDSVISIIDLRSVEQIQADIEDMTGQMSGVDQTMSRAKQLQIRADTEIKVKESQIQSLSAQIDLAKKEKNALQTSDLEAKKRLAELEKQLLQRRKGLRDREIDYWNATRSYADLRRKSLDAEMTLAQLRAQRDGLTGSANSPAVYTQMQQLDTQLREAERRTLDAQIDAANQRQAIAKQEAEVLKAKKEIFDAQFKLKMGG